MIPIECVMRCPVLPEPVSASFESLRLWAFDTTQRYEICARRHEDCAVALEAQ
ncbi:MAG: hypothetical protein FWH15_09545 [Betaproteobacteria bacterium]|nr:hypothetical protein [Betaproteobacteria bacterium]